MPDPQVFVVDSIPPASDGPPLWKTGWLTKGVIQSIYSLKSGKLIVPIAGNDNDPGPPAIVAKVHRAYWVLTVAFDLSRIGANPVIPDFDLGADYELLESDIGPFAPRDQDGSQPRTECSGFYKWLMYKSPTKQSGFTSADVVYWSYGASKFTTANFRKDMTMGQ